MGPFSGGAELYRVYPREATNLSNHVTGECRHLLITMKPEPVEGWRSSASSDLGSYRSQKQLTGEFSVWVVILSAGEITLYSLINISLLWPVS